MTDALGKVTNAHQVSIGEKVNLNKINDIFLDNLEKIKTISLKNKDPYFVDIIESLENNKKLCFPINKHMELFINKNSSDLEKISRYALFRYKFYIAGSKKINLGYPPYLLIETVSTCNLRCPFCFQTDKSFTRKPFMGVIDFDFFKKIVDQADQLGTGAITIGSRGEPTMHKKFSEMLEYINTKKIS